MMNKYRMLIQRQKRSIPIFLLQKRLLKFYQNNMAIKETIRISNYHRPNYKYTNDELKIFDEELKKYFITKKNDFFNGKEIKFLDEIKWLKDNRALTKDNKVIINNYIAPKYSSDGKLITPTDCDPIKYEELNDKLDQWKLWKGRIEKREYYIIQGLNKLYDQTLIKNNDNNNE